MIPVQIKGCGHALGGDTVCNRSLAESKGLPSDWFVERTGIERRHVCGPGENATQLAKRAVEAACLDARLVPSALGSETILLHIQNGLTHLTPPSGILLCHALGFRNVRVLSIDGVCAEPVAALEIASLMLLRGSCERVIVSASADFLRLVDPNDLDTVALFGCGAGAFVLERSPEGGASCIRGLRWSNDTRYWDLGVSPVMGSTLQSDRLSIDCGYYKMRGKELARVGFRAVPNLVAGVLSDASWSIRSIDYVAVHQPNMKMLSQFLQQMDLGDRIDEQPGACMGNLGPASVLVALSIAKQRARLTPGTKLLFLSFGLGFSVGAAAIII